MALGKLILDKLSEGSDKYLVATESYGNDHRQSYDLYSSPDATDHMRKTIVFIYGGYWRGGDKSEYGYVGKTFAGMGYNVVVINYRLYPAVTHPAFVHDAAEAINHYQKNYHEHKPSELIIVAHSAGAQIGALLCYSAPYRKLLHNPDSIIAFVGLGGAYGFTRDSHPLIDIFPATDKSNWQPIAAADTFTIPALLLGAKFDIIVASWSTVNMGKLLKSHGLKVRYKLFIASQHGPLVLGLRRRHLVPTAEMREITRFLSTL